MRRAGMASIALGDIPLCGIDAASHFQYIERRGELRLVPLPSGQRPGIERLAHLRGTGGRNRRGILVKLQALGLK